MKVSLPFFFKFSELLDLVVYTKPNIFVAETTVKNKTEILLGLYQTVSSILEPECGIDPFTFDYKNRSLPRASCCRYGCSHLANCNQCPQNPKLINKLKPQHSKLIQHFNLKCKRLLNSYQCLDQAFQ